MPLPVQVAKHGRCIVQYKNIKLCDEEGAGAMAHNRRLLTDADFTEAMEAGRPIRVFKDGLVADSGGRIARFDDRTVVIESGAGDVRYHTRSDNEFFERRGS